MKHNQEKTQSIERDLNQIFLMTELSDKDVKTAIINVLYILKNA